MREAWFSALGTDVVGASVLDLFAGSGALGIEALSRGADSAVFVDRQRAAIRTVRANLEALGVTRERATVAEQDVFRFLRRVDDEVWDLALADPPYGTGDAARLVERYLDRPFASELWVEHRSGELEDGPAASRRRRYGDTTLSTYRGAET